MTYKTSSMLSQLTSTRDPRDVFSNVRIKMHTTDTLKHKGGFCSRQATFAKGYGELQRGYSDNRWKIQYHLSSGNIVSLPCSLG